MSVYEQFVSETGRLLACCESPPDRCYAGPGWFVPACGSHIEPPIGGNPEGINARGRVWYRKDDLPKWALGVS